MKYVALLRGINVGGKNMIKMADLKQCLEQAGLEKVTTFIQSGNVVFESRNRNVAKLTEVIETAVAARFGIPSRVVVLSYDQLKAVIAAVPAAWNSSTDLRCNIAFFCRPGTETHAIKDVEARPGIDSVATGPGVLYMSTLLAELTRSGMPKLASKPLYREMTVRGFNTCQRLLTLMEDKRRR